METEQLQIIMSLFIAAEFMFTCQARSRSSHAGEYILPWPLRAGEPDAQRAQRGRFASCSCLLRPWDAAQSPLRHHTRPHDPDPVRKAAPLLQRTPEYQYLPKRRRTRLHPVSCPGASQQSSSGAWKGAPRGVGELDVPCLSRFPVHLLPLSHPLVSSSDTSIHSALPAPQIHLFRGGPHPLAHRVTPSSGHSLPLGAPLPLVRAHFILHPQKTETHRRQGLFGLFCTS